jgi:lipoprotein-releasing system permease protein
LFNAFNPDLKITLAEGKYYKLTTQEEESLAKIDGIYKVSKVLEEISLFEYKGAQEAGIIKGVDQNYNLVTAIDSTLFRGKFILGEKGISYGVLGGAIYGKLAINPTDAITPVTVYMLKRQKSGPMSKDYKSLPLYPSGSFSIGGEEDNQYIISEFEFVNALLDLENNISSLEIKLSPDADENKVRESIAKAINTEVVIKNRYQQDEDYLKIMNIEKWISYLIATLTMLIIAFNMIGALWMIVLDKRLDIAILKSLGSEEKDIKQIFSRVGLLIGGIGLVLGILIAVVMFFLQKQYGIIGVPQGFMIDAYPIAFKVTDFLLVIFTVLTISFFASLFPAIKASKSPIALKGK